ncbi:MarR family transcriptional regulator [Stenotrophomonas sp. NLF4-10]|uniref:MarR family winged helix-turn-helix transcriptional regulator n=1 Tax=Stenotrophomonas sp. NLF4-10 TaxID=2918754 RepID=UPI001EFAFD86|nr:MarR family transcriptional regulator [Stenotrophomonas sp. NLF4-10]MCG8276864.1 MarR family transcriptional regulator [Stenotrophomonas sp. NLF4-10]
MPDNRDIEILNLINALAHQATAAMQRSLRDTELGLVAMEARTLRFIARHPGCTQNDIVRESGRDKAQIARITKVLLERGDIRKRAIEGGKRQHLEVTPAGAKLHAKAEALRTVVAQALVEGLAPEECNALERMLRRMTQADQNP